MVRKRSKSRWVVAPALVSAAVAVAVPVALGFQTKVEPFVKAPPAEPSSPYWYEPLLSVRDIVRRTSKRTQRVQMLTIPDGLGALPGVRDGDDERRSGLVAGRRGEDDDRFALFMNHEHAKVEDQEFVLGAAKYQGAIITLWQLEADDGEVEVDSGDLAYQVVEDTLTGRRHGPARAGNVADAFGRFCSGFLAWDYRRFGFDRPIYFAGEEARAGADRTYYEELGGTAVAVFERKGRSELHTLPDLGFYPRENVIPIAGYRGFTVLLGLEDGPAGYQSQLHLYVGRQMRGSKDPMKRNGLVGGKLYVLRVNGALGERQFELQNGDRTGRWLEVPEPRSTSETGLETFSQASDAFDHFRIEDGHEAGKQLVYATTGGDETAGFAATLTADRVGNYYGRLYVLHLDAADPTGDPRLVLEYDADEAVSAADPPNRPGGNALINSDNMTVSTEGHLLVQENATGHGNRFMRSQMRDAQIWRFELTGSLRSNLAIDEASGRPVAEVICIYDGGRDNLCGGNPVPNPGGAQGYGTWETSGIIDADHVIGEDTFLLDVQAHREAALVPSEPDYGEPLEDGQLGVLWPLDDD
jgi:uncharacterized protein DUF839